MRKIRKKGLVLVLLLVCLCLGGNLYAEYTDVSTVEFQQFCNKAKYIIPKNTLMANSAERFKLFFNAAKNRNFQISAGFAETIRYNNGKITQGWAYCEILEKSKINEKIVRVKMMVPFATNQLADHYWTHIGFVYDREEYVNNYL